MNVDPAFWELVVAEMSGEMSENQRKELDSMITRDEELRVVFYGLNSITVDAFQEDMDGSGCEIYERIAQKIDSRGRKGIKYYLIRVAAAACILWGCWMSYMFGTTRNVDHGAIVEYTCQNGGYSRLMLPDGTEVYVNSGSVLKYPAKFPGDGRNVEIDGEAYFNVAHDPSKPFVVRNRNLSVKALGTSFGIKGYEQDTYVRTTLVEGEVEVSIDGLRNKHILSPGRQAVFNRSDMSVLVEDVDTEFFTSWIKGHIAFTQMKFSDICVFLERKFGVDIIIEYDELAKKVFSGRFIYGENLYQVLDVIRQNTPFSYRMRNNNTLTITKVGAEMSHCE